MIGVLLNIPKSNTRLPYYYFLSFGLSGIKLYAKIENVLQSTENHKYNDCRLSETSKMICPVYEHLSVVVHPSLSVSVAW